MTLALFGPERRVIELGDGLRVTLYERWLDAEAAAILYTALDGLPFERRKLCLFGREVVEPRDTFACGAAYTYSGIQHPARAIPRQVQAVANRVEHELGELFNTLLVTRYADGRDAIGWHADNERELGVDPVIASVSLGATRRFRIRYPGRAMPEFDLTDGMLLVMGAGVQARCLHQIPYQSGVGPRISLTLRRIVR